MKHMMNRRYYLPMTDKAMGCMWWSKQHLFIPCVSIHTWGMITSNSVHKLADTAPTYKQWGFRCRIVSQLTKRIIVAVCVCALWENAGCICSGINGH